jgi:CBS domain-containing protein
MESTRTGEREVLSITQYQRVTDAALIMAENGVGSLIIVADDDDNTMVGILSERDILRWIGHASPETYFQKVQEIMTQDVISCEPGVPLTECWNLMMKHGIRHMPIVQNGAAVNMLSVRDMMEHLAGLASPKPALT